MYADAVCGVPICGNAVCGTWWAYPPSPDLDLYGVVPSDIFIGVIVQAPAAELDLWAVPPSLLIVDFIVIAVTAAELDLGSIAPVLLIDTILQPLAAELELLADVHFAGQVWLWPSKCGEVALVPSEPTTVVLAPVVCR